MGFSFGDALGFMANPTVALGTATQLYDGYQNRQAQKDANAANIAQADKQMEFQERMSNTAYQRSMQDMKKAGLNPILSARNPASSPSGSSAQINPIPALGIGSAVNTALSSAQSLANIDLTEAQAAKTKTETNIKSKEEPMANVKKSIFEYLEEYFKKFTSSAKERDQKMDSLYDKIDKAFSYDKIKNAPQPWENKSPVY